MTEEEHFRKYYPDFCYGDRPLSPYWDLFQYGVEFGERQSEKKIEELEKENAKLKKKYYKKAVKDYCELEKENRDLRDNYIGFKSIAIPERERLQKENAELKEKINILENCDRLGDTITEAYKEQLTKAKELLTKWVELFKPKGGNIPPTPIQVDTEQFLKEIE